MKTRPHCLTTLLPSPPRRGYLLLEALVYLSLVFAIMGVGYAALHLCIDSSVALRRNADEIAHVLHAGELWRADIRASAQVIEPEMISGQEVLHLKGINHDVFYSFSDGAVRRRAGAGPWVNLLSPVKSSTMRSELQFQITAWRWEVELQVQAKGKGRIESGHVRPLFTFIAVPSAALSP